MSCVLFVILELTTPHSIKQYSSELNRRGWFYRQERAEESRNKEQKAYWLFQSHFPSKG